MITVDPPGDVHIGPEEDFDSAWLHRTYVLENGTLEPLSWKVRVSEPWLGLSGPELGALAPGESREVPVDIDPYAASLGGAEQPSADVLFLEGVTGAVLATRRVTVGSTFEAFADGGWTAFARSVDTLTIFVSSSDGDDHNDGLSPATPKRSIAAGQALLRSGYPDWLLLKRGDAWQESLGQWKKPGRSSSEPMLIAAYGEAQARPLLRTGSLGGLWTGPGGASPAHVDNLAVVGLHFHADGFSGVGDCVGAQMLQPSSHVLIEDCEFQGYSTNLVFQGYGGRHSDFRLRRSVIVDAYSVHGSGAHPQGLYAYAVDGLLVEDNVFDHNGWSETVPDAGADIYSHNLYIDNDNTAVSVRGNIIARASSHGMQLRSGGSVVNNLFLTNSISLSVGGGNNPNPGGVTADVRGNVVLDGKDIDAANPRGWGMWFANIATGRVSHNLIANNSHGTQPAVMTLDGVHVGDSGPGVGIHQLMIEKNILYNWGGTIDVEGDSNQLTNIDFLENDVQDRAFPDPLIRHLDRTSLAAFHSSGNRFFSVLLPPTAWTEIAAVPRPIAFWQAVVSDTTSAAQPALYPDPERSMASYNVLLGGSFGLTAFLAEARQQSKRNWRPAYSAVQANRYVRAGF